jgi:hypothetical protein
MKPVVTRLYVLLVVLTLVGLAAWAVADWYQLRQGAVTGGQAVLRQTAGLITDLSLRPTPAQPADLAQAVTKGTKADPRWKVLVLSGATGTEFYRGPRPPVPVEQAVPRWSPQEGSEVVVALPVFRANGTPLSLEGIYEFYGRAEVFSLLKACGITLVILLVLTVVVVFVSAARDDARSARPDDTRADEASPAYEWGDDLPPASAEVDVPEDEYWFDEDSALDDLPPLEPMETLEPLETVAEAASTPSSATTAAPRDTTPPAPSLFSPTTGLCWGEFLDTRLSQELVRASGLNQDLGLVLLAFKDGKPDPAAWGKAVREAFPSIDLDFDYENGAAVVLPGQSLDQALRVARSFVDNLERKWGVQVHAGVAARSGRLVSGSTLLSEAASARRRTLAGTVRVLGLKTDPDRWREHLAGEAS